MNRMQAWWFARQGLDTPQPLSPADGAHRYGWLRSVGSANPYLAIRSRTGARRAEIERAVADTELVELPAARGCTYYVPRDEAALALRLAAMGSCNAEFKMAEKHLGATEEEVAKLADDMAAALTNGPLDARAISTIVSPRHLGEAGKKKGMTTTATLGISRLQVEGRIRRLPQGGRLDTERFQYALWEDGPRPGEVDEETWVHDLADRYFSWTGPATEKEFREFTGLSAKLSRLAIAELIPCPDDPSMLMRQDDVVAYEAVEKTDGRVVLLSSIDSWIHLRRNLPPLLDPVDAERTLPNGDKLQGANSLKDIDSHPIAMDGVVVGIWEYDYEAQEIAAWTWRPCAAVTQAIEETGKWIAEELGDFRSFSLDSPKSRVPRIELIRSLA
jgi:hypothetical protein